MASGPFSMRHSRSIVLLAILCGTTGQRLSGQTSQQLSEAAAANDWKLVESLAQSVIRSHRADPLAWTYLGFAHSHLNQRHLAAKDFERAVRIAPEATYSHNNYGTALEALGRRGEAARQYEISLKLDAAQPAAFVNLARIRAAEESPSARRQALSLLEHAWKLAPDAEIAATLLQLQPCARSENRATPPWVNLDEYAANLLEWKTQVAESTLISAAEALANCGDVYQQAGHPEVAVPAMLRSIDLAPENELLRFRYGMLLIGTKAPKAAEIRIQEALQLFPSSTRLWFALGLAYFDQTMPAKAQEAFDQGLKIEPKSPPLLAYRGLTALDQQHYSEAESYYRKAIAADPSSADLHCLLAEAMEKSSGDAGQVRTELKKAMEIDPRLVAAHIRLGRLELNQGDAAAAVRELKLALALDPSQQEIHFYLARAYQKMHDTEHAREEGRLCSELQAANRDTERNALKDLARRLGQTTF